eukprot:TRINITY_DN67881_c1_g3_i5.p3 TRINITY_DN67881_c1_g3~~TRINITY_DN67881_c1_g3_i5.p3  ORF type:complete len:100 (+),score=4.52 TRINITY_DN67881_c1_g3_i5:456-755(+)
MYSWAPPHCAKGMTFSVEHQHFVSALPPMFTSEHIAKPINNCWLNHTNFACWSLLQSCGSCVFVVHHKGSLRFVMNSQTTLGICKLHRPAAHSKCKIGL